MKPKTLFFTLRYAVFGCGLLAGLFGILSGALQVDAGTHYFLRGALFPILSLIFALLGVVLALVAGFFEPKAEAPEPRRFPYLIPAAGFLASTFVVFFMKGSATKISIRLAVTATILLVLSVLFCILFFLLKDPKYNGLLAILGFFPILSPAALAFFYYFDKTVEMNSPFKVALQTGLLFSMALFLCEVRFLVGRARPRLLAGLRLALFPANAIGIGMTLAAYFSGNFARTDYLLGAILLFSLQLPLVFDLFPAKQSGNI